MKTVLRAASAPSDRRIASGPPLKLHRNTTIRGRYEVVKAAERER
jgi:hypothetical protein